MAMIKLLTSVMTESNNNRVAATSATGDCRHRILQLAHKCLRFESAFFVPAISMVGCMEALRGVGFCSTVTDTATLYGLSPIDCRLCVVVFDNADSRAMIMGIPILTSSIPEDYFGVSSSELHPETFPIEAFDSMYDRLEALLCLLIAAGVDHPDTFLIHHAKVLSALDQIQAAVRQQHALVESWNECFEKKSLEDKS